MKKYLVWLISICSILGLVLAAPIYSPNGFGKVVVATTTAQQIQITENNTNITAAMTSIYNAGTNTVFCSVNCASTSAFAIVNSNNEAVPIPASQIFTFQAPGKIINSIWIKTTNGTSTVMIGAY